MERLTRRISELEEVKSHYETVKKPGIDKKTLRK